MKYTIGQIILVIVLIVGLYAIIKFFIKVLHKIRERKFVPKRVFLSRKIKSKADRKFNKLLNKFKHRYGRNPNKKELFRIIINASHITIRRRGTKGHWGRQKVRKYLLEKHGITEKYIMR